MKHILKLSLVLLVILSSCGRLYDYDENAQVIIHVGFDTEKVSHYGSFLTGVSHEDNDEAPVIKIPYTNGSEQTIYVTGNYDYIPAGLDMEQECIVPAAEQGVLDISVFGAIESAVGADSLVFYVSTGARTWEVIYHITIVDPNANIEDLEIVDATFNASLMSGVDIKTDINGDRSITVSYINGGGRKVKFSTGDPSGENLLDVSVDSSSSYLEMGSGTVELQISGRYSGDADFVDLTLYAHELSLEDGTTVNTTEYPIYDIEVSEPNILTYSVNTFYDTFELGTGLNNVYATIAYANGENRNVIIDCEVISDEAYTEEELMENSSRSNDKFYINGSEGTYQLSTVLNATTGSFILPITGTPSKAQNLTISVKISGDSIEDYFAETALTGTVKITF